MRPKVFWGLALAVIALAGWARLASHAAVFTKGGVELVPTDSHYYVRFASLQLERFPGFRDFDPLVNYPSGAQIYWPPLHTWAVAAAVALRPLEPERAAAFVGPVFALLELLLLAGLLRRLLGERVALASLTLLALTPVAIYVGAVGNVDHHVHEPILAVASALLLGRAFEDDRRALAIAAGALLGLGRFFNPGVFFLIPCLAASVVLWALLRRVDAARCARLALWLGASCAAVLMLGVASFGRLVLGYEQFSLFQPLWALALFTGAASIAGLLSGERRWAIALFASALLLVPLAPQLARALGALGREDPLLALVVESQPLWRYPSWALIYFGGVLFLAPLGLFGAVKYWSQNRALVPVLVTAAFLMAASLLQARFVQPLVGLWAVLIPFGLFTLADGLSLLLRRGVLGLSGVFGLTLLTGLAPVDAPANTDEGMVRSAMDWLRTSTPSPGDPPRYGIVSSQDLGHLVTLWAQRPAVATPFSQAPWHIAGNLRASSVLAAESDEEAYAAAKATSARYVLVIPFQKILGFPAAKDERTLARRLLEHAGLDSGGMGHFRLVFESPEQRLRKEGGSFARIFEVVEGATITGNAPAGNTVEARLAFESNLGTRRQYTRATTADPAGRFTLRLAYPGRYRLETASGPLELEVTEAAVRQGSRLELAPQTATPPAP